VSQVRIASRVTPQCSGQSADPYVHSCLLVSSRYKEQLKSPIADFVNTGSRAGGSITASLFLKEVSCCVRVVHFAYYSRAQSTSSLPSFGRLVVWTVSISWQSRDILFNLQRSLYHVVSIVGSLWTRRFHGLISTSPALFGTKRKEGPQGSPFKPWYNGCKATWSPRRDQGKVTDIDMVHDLFRKQALHDTCNHAASEPD
jgi:hypothetical protein